MSESTEHTPELQTRSDSEGSCARRFNKRLREGDRIRFTTADSVLQYVVCATRIAEPSDVSVLDPTPGQTLTLVTCYPFYYLGSAPKRFIVQTEMTPDLRQ